MTAMRLSGECPRCNSALTRRTRRSDGQPFLSCTAYPGCKFAEDWDPQVNELHAVIKTLKMKVRELESRPKSNSIDVSKELRKIITHVHPDRWPGNLELAHEVTTLINALREKL